MTFDGRVARRTRLAAILLCPPLLAFAYERYCANILWSLALAYVPLLFGSIGLIARSVLDAATERTDLRNEFSAKGALLGSAGSFFVLLLFIPHSVDRTALVAIFLASLLFYYAVGKIGCVFLGCCRAAVPWRLPLPTIEAICSLALSLAALATLYEASVPRLFSTAAILGCSLALRLFSRCMRGSSLGNALKQFDSIALGVLICGTAAIAVLR